MVTAKGYRKRIHHEPHTCWELAQQWYRGRTERDWMRPDKDRMKVLFSSLGLSAAIISCRTEPTATAAPTPLPTLAIDPIQVSQEAPLLPNPFEPIDIQMRAADSMKMVFVPAGEFNMGNSNEQIEQVLQDCLARYGESGECQQEVSGGLHPAHNVSLDSFWLDQTEVTNAMYTDFLNDQGNQSENGVDWFEPGAGHRRVVNGYIRDQEGIFETLAGYEDHPVIEVSWYGASAYCAWIGGRLPTEAE